MIINVLENGLINDKALLQSKALQEIVDKFSSPDNVIYFPRGTYVLSTIFLKNNTHFNFAKGAKILGADSFYEYASEEKIDYPLYQDSSHSFFDCSLFVGMNVENVSFDGQGIIDMRSVWDLDNVRNIVHRGPKCIALKNCKNVLIKGLCIYNVTDLAVYFAGCENVEVCYLKLKVYIDGISPDCSKNVSIHDCYIESGDDGIVFKSSYTLNRLEICKDIKVENCVCKSRCNAIKFGTETNGGFEDITINNIKVFNSRITGISLETVDGANIKNIAFSNITMKNVGTPIFVHIGNRMRGPKELTIGSIENVIFENITAKGPYKLYKCMAWNYDTFVKNDVVQYPGRFSTNKKEATGSWQISSNVCGYLEHKIKDIKFKNIDFILDGGVEIFSEEVSEKPKEYPEVDTYGRILPASGIYFRHIDGLTLENVNIKLLHKDKRKLFVFDDVKMN